MKRIRFSLSHSIFGVGDGAERKKGSCQTALRVNNRHAGSKPRCFGEDVLSGEDKT